MPLNEMSLQAMARLADDIDALRAAMAILADRGLVAHADLSPGTPMMIALVREMPPARWPETEPEDLLPVPGEVTVTYNGAPVADRDPDKYARATGLIDNEGFAVESHGRAFDLAASMPTETLARAAAIVESAIDHNLSFDAFKEKWQTDMPLPAATPITAEAPPAGDTGESVVPAPEPAVTGPGEAAAPPAAPGPNPWPVWTEDDVDRLIEAVAAGMEFDGLSLRAAAMRAAPALGRPGDGTYMKARSLIERIEARRRDMALAAAGNKIPAGPPAPAVQETAPEGAGEPAASEGPEDAEGVHHGPGDASARVVAGTDAPLTPYGEMCAYLRSLPRKRGWTVQRDHDVLHFAELAWKPAEIALELGIPADELKPRFAMLTRTGQYKRAEVLAALTEMLAAEGKAA